MGKLGLEIKFIKIQKTAHIGGTFGEISESLCNAFRAMAAPVNGRRLELNLIMHPTHPKSILSGRESSPGHPYALCTNFRIGIKMTKSWTICMQDTFARATHSA